MRLKEFANIEEGLFDQQTFKAVFMAGAPGSGKSIIASKLFGGTGLKSMNVDDFWHLYKAMGKEGDYERYWELYKAREKNYLAGRLGLLIDGTARNPEAMAGVKNKLESLGYDTAMVFVNTSLEVSLARTVRRAQTPGKDLGRTVDEDFVTRSWEQVQRGLGKLQSMFGRNFYIVDNNRGEPQLDYVEKSLRNWLEKPANRPAAREWQQQQAELRRRDTK
jgi:predicted kinase